MTTEIVVNIQPRPVSYSEIDTYRQCPLKHDLKYRLGYKPPTEKEAFRLGHIWHEIMQVHYGVIKEWQELTAKVTPHASMAAGAKLLEHCAREVGYVLDNVDADTRDLMQWAYSGYVEMYGTDHQWRIIATEVKGQTPLEPGGPEFVWVIDLVVEDYQYGGIWIIDHKFPGDLASDVEIDLDDQLGLYWLGWSLSGDPLCRNVNGAMLNQSRKKRNVGDMVPPPLFANGKPKGKPQSLDQRFLRTRTSRTLDECRAIGQDAIRVTKVMKFAQENDATYASPNPQTCKWKCDFRDQHILSRSSGIPITEVVEDFGFVSRAQRDATEAASHMPGCILPLYHDEPCTGEEGEL